MKNKNIYLWGAGVLILSVTGYLVYKKWKNRSLEESTDNENTIVNKSVKYTVNDSFPLDSGSKGSNVLALQIALNKLGAGIKEDGIFGSQTYGAVVSKIGFGTVPVTAKSYEYLLKKIKEEEQLALLTGKK